MTTDNVDALRRLRRREMDRLGRRRRQLAMLAGQPTSLVPAAPIRARLKTLHNLGWSYEALAAINGAGTATALNLIASGASAHCERKFEPVAALPVTLNVPDSVGDNMWVPTLGATRRVRALLALGWRHQDIAEVIGRSSSSIASGTYLRTRAIDWRVVDAAYERMSTGRGASERTSIRALERGYAPPFAWNDIDDPNEKPRKGSNHARKTDIDPIVVERVLMGERLPTTRAEKLEITRRWEADGRSLKSLERLTGWNSDRYTEREDGAA